MSPESIAFWTLVATAAGVLVGVATAVVTILPWLRQEWDKRLLMQKLGRGPYDQATIESATRYYVRPKCSNIDPAQEKDMRHALVATREDMFSVVDRFLDGEEYGRHLLVLADSGTGKTSFMLNYYVHNARRRKPHRITLVPLGVKDADELIDAVEDQKEAVICLDALDEDTKAIQDHRQRVRDLMGKCQRFRRVVITCRTQFFPSEEEIPVETGIARIGPRRAGEGGHYEFRKIYLSPFDDKEVATYFRLRYPVWRWRDRQAASGIAKQIPSLTVRPMLLAHIPEILAERGDPARKYELHELYEMMVRAWIQREQGWVDKDALRRFSELLAVDAFVKREERGSEAVSRAELEALTQEWGIALQPWQFGGRSLLNRDAIGNLKFAHRTISEYLFVRRLVLGDPDCSGTPLTDFMEELLCEMTGVTKEQATSFNKPDVMVGLTQTSIKYRSALDVTAMRYLRWRYPDVAPAQVYLLSQWRPLFLDIAQAVLYPEYLDEKRASAIGVEHLPVANPDDTPTVRVVLNSRKLTGSYSDAVITLSYKNGSYLTEPAEFGSPRDIWLRDDDTDRRLELTLELMKKCGANVFDELLQRGGLPGLIAPAIEATVPIRIVGLVYPPPLRRLARLMEEYGVMKVSCLLWAWAMPEPYATVLDVVLRLDWRRSDDWAVVSPWALPDSVIPGSADGVRGQTVADDVRQRIQESANLFSAKREFEDMQRSLPANKRLSRRLVVQPITLGNRIRLWEKLREHLLGVVSLEVCHTGEGGAWEQTVAAVAEELRPYLVEYYLNLASRIGGRGKSVAGFLASRAEES